MNIKIGTKKEICDILNCCKDTINILSLEIDYISSKEMGNVTISSWKTPSKESFLFEGYYLLSCIADKKLQLQKFFPPTRMSKILSGSRKNHRIWGLGISSGRSCKI